MSFVKKLAGETVIYGMSSILPKIIYFLLVTSYITYRFPDTLDFGIYNYLYAYSTIILVVFLFRMDTAFFRFGSGNGKEKIFGSALIPVVIISLIGVSVMWSLAEQIAIAIGFPGSGYYVKWFAIILGCDALAGMFYARFRLQSRPYRFLFFRLANIIITIFFIFLFLEALPSLGIQWIKVDRLIDYVFIANLIGSATTLFLMVPEIRNIKFSVDWVLIKKMFMYSTPLVLVGIAGNINQTFATPLQKFFLGEDSAANLTVAGAYMGPARIALLLNLFTVAFNYAAEPFFFNNRDKENATEAYGQILHVFVLASGLAMIGIVCFQEVAILLIGESYRGPQDIIPILLFANLFLGIYYNISIWYKLSDKTIYGAILSIIGAIITLIISMVFLPKIGYIASAYAALACYGVMVLLCYFLGQKHFPIPYPVKTVLTFGVTLAFYMAGVIYLKSLGVGDVMKLVIGTISFILFSFWIYKVHGKQVKNYLLRN